MGIHREIFNARLVCNFKKEALEVFIHTPLTRTRQLCSAQPEAGSVPVATPREKVASVLWLAKLDSVAAVQRDIRIEYERGPPTHKPSDFGTTHCGLHESVT